MKKQIVIAKKSEDTPNMVSLLFSASPKFDWIPLGGGLFGILDNCAGVSSVKAEDIIDLLLNAPAVRSVDAGGYEESRIGEIFLLGEPEASLNIFG